MKKSLKGITIPYPYYNSSFAYLSFIYKDKEYRDLGKLFKDFLGITLVYHYEINDKVYEVNNYDEVLYAICLHANEFKIDRKYRKEYSKQEYDYLNKLQDSIINNKLKIEYYESDIKFHSFKERRLYHIDKEFRKYRNVLIPKKVKCEKYNIIYYVVGGEYYDNIYSALDIVYDNNLYYPYGGSKRINDRSHRHVHSFLELICAVFEDNKYFKIHTFQGEFYSKQEIDVLSCLSDKLTSMGFSSVVRSFDQTDYDEYHYLKDNKKYIKLFIYNIKNSIKDKKFNKNKLDSHKI